MNFPRAFRRVAQLGGALCVSALIAACGGGDQVDQFQPARILSFGDEVNVIDDTATGAVANNGRKHTVNYIDTTVTPNALSCAVYPTWNQLLATRYGLLFPQCGSASAASRILARAGEPLVADVETQITRFLASADGPFRESDLVTIYTGTADVIAAASVDDVLAAANRLAVQVKRVTDTGARVAFVTLPRTGETPWGRSLGTVRKDQLSDYARRFNVELRSRVPQDGRKVAVVDAYERIRAISYYLFDGDSDKRQGSYDGFSNVTTPACASVTFTAPAPAVNTLACDTTTLNTAAGVTPSNLGAFLWADNIRWAPGAHTRIGDLAYDRIRAHPF